MSDNIKLFRNYLLYFLTFILVCIIGITDVFGAELSSMKFIGRSSYQYPFSTSYEPFNYTADYFTFNGADTLPNYAVLTTCGTGALGFNITNTSGNFSYIDYVELNNTCTTQGFQGYEYIYYFKFNQWTDAGNGNFGVSFNNYVSNIFGYITYVTFEDLKFTDTINLQELKQQQQIINQNNQNSQNIINNNNQNTQNIINNQNENTQDLIDSNKVCYNQEIIINNTNKDKFNIGWISINNSITNNSSFRYSDYIKINKDDLITITRNRQEGNANAYCIYNTSKTLISCTEYGTNLSSQYTVTQDGYVRFSGSISTNTDTTLFIKTCKNGNQALNDSITDLNDSLNDDDSSGATSEASEFFSSFTTNTFGLTSIITAPLNLIQSLTSSTCSELHLPLPYLNNKYLDLPCMTSIYQTHFGTFFTMYQTITYGIIAYWVCVRIFNQVKDFKNPEHDEIEVVDL